MKKLALLTVLFSLLISCSSKDTKLVLQNSAGQVNQLLVVMDNTLYQGVEGDELRKVTGEEVLGLPQEEPQFKVTQISPFAFKNLFKTQRNILIVQLGKQHKCVVKKDVYASPQVVVLLTAKNKKDLIKLIQENKQKITSSFKNSDIKVLQKRNRKSLFDTSKLKTLANMNVDLEIPFKFKLVDDTGDFLWLRRRIKQGQSVNIIVYQLPINSVKDEEGKNIVSVRDTIGKKYIPGQYDGTYLITEQAYSPHTFNIELNGKKAFETRGKWEVKGDYMAGPFLNYTVIDKANNRLVVVEGFVFSPATNKRDYMFELEAILKTLKIKSRENF